MTDKQSYEIVDIALFDDCNSLTDSDPIPPGYTESQTGTEVETDFTYSESSSKNYLDEHSDEKCCYILLIYFCTFITIICIILMGFAIDAVINCPDRPTGGKNSCGAGKSWFMVEVGFISYVMAISLAATIYGAYRYICFTQTKD